MDAYKGYDTADTNRIAMLSMAGREMDSYAQRPLTAAYDDFLRGQEDPYRRLDAYTRAYGAGVNGQSVQSTPTGNSPAANLLGGATSALGLYNLFTQPQQNQPWSFNPMTGARL